MSTARLAIGLWLAACLSAVDVRAQGAPPESGGGGVTGLTGGSTVVATVPYLAPNGSCAAPSFAWNSDADGTGSGWYRQAANVWSLCLNGVELYRFTATEARLLNGAALWAGTVRDPNGNQQIFFSTISGNLLSNQAAATAGAWQVGNSNAVTSGYIMRWMNGLNPATNQLAEVNATDFKTFDGIYLQSGNWGNAAPPAADCDNDSEIGRQFLDNTASPRRQYICTGASGGWDHVALTD
jgi:hypothetical protein